jgi:hypothetical protein
MAHTEGERSDHLLHCAEDEANIVILERLLAMGFSKVRFLKGGLDAWKARGFKVDGYSDTFLSSIHHTSKPGDSASPRCFPIHSTIGSKRSRCLLSYP